MLVNLLHRARALPALAVAALAGGALILAGGGAYAATALTASTAPAPHAGYACVNLSKHVVMSVMDSPSAACPVGTTSIVLGARGATGLTGLTGAPGAKGDTGLTGAPGAKGDTGLTGAPGAKGDTGLTGAPGAKGDTGSQGIQGASGVVAASTTQLDASTVTEPAGGPFASNAAEVGTGVFLKAGTYLVSLSAKAAAPSGGTGAVEVFPQFFVYDQVKNAAFTGDLFNVGSGALESGVNSNIDSYYSGSSLVVLPADTTLHVYAFGYDSDRGSLGYSLESLSVTAVQVTPAS